MKRDKRIPPIRVSKEELERMQQCADIATNGNLSEWIRAASAATMSFNKLRRAFAAVKNKGVKPWKTDKK